MPMEALPELPPGALGKQDTGDDAAFYASARLVTHIDAAAAAALTAYYAAVLPADAVILDLMSSWVSHLPDNLATGTVIGHGMNGAELAANPRLDRWFVQDLNRTPTLDLTDDSCDAVLCCVGVQYLQQPLAVLREVRRVLRPGAPVLISFSNRCFPTKAVAIWRRLEAGGHAALVKLYLEKAGFSAPAATVLSDGSCGDPLIVVRGEA